MVTGLAAAVFVGAIVGALTMIDGRLRIADEAPLAMFVGASGAVVGWAVVHTFGISGGAEVGAADVVAPLAGAVGISVLAWRGRRRTFSDIGLRPHSD